MKKMTFVLTVLLCDQLAARACTMRVGYPDRERLPYYLGSGTVVPEPAGPGVELLRAAVRSVGCTAHLVRLPTARLRYALIDGSVDLAPVDLRDGERRYSALPLTAGGAPDTRRGIRVTAVVYVRSADRIAPGTSPRRYFKQRRLATNQGSPLGEQLRDEGYLVDSGAGDAVSNLDKLVIGRVDGFAMSLANADALDRAVQQRYGDRVIRLTSPIRASTLWLSSSNAYYQAHRQQIEQLWNWWGDNAARTLGELLRAPPAR
ncbi:hypothetical protein ASF61_14025 [Duganella sp. Leaf126]|uniref:hypothetical protein n=1 Tax=Duganella sp. Leaf126 TaxID=1736266 RepID=UPI0006F5F4E1|nr:hypothetical protein [Duganella sp. Leaf126]KQQ32656.1 hypothetical protein ASF61_14025 [Duganella sp. Leaf126]